MFCIDCFKNLNIYTDLNNTVKNKFEEYIHNKLRIKFFFRLILHLKIMDLVKLVLKLLNWPNK